MRKEKRSALPAQETLFMGGSQKNGGGAVDCLGCHAGKTIIITNKKKSGGFKK